MIKVLIFVLSTIYQTIVQNFRNEYVCTQCTYDKIVVGFKYIIFEGIFFFKNYVTEKNKSISRKIKSYVEVFSKV